MRAVRYRRATTALALAALCLGCSGCYHLPSGPVKRSEVVGRYVFRMDDSGAPHHDRDRLTLKPDGSYVLVHMPSGHPGPVERGTWTVNNEFQPSVVFGGRVYPIEVRGAQLRLDVEPDLGYYWYKVEK